MPTITGTNGNDILADNQGNDVINALGGDDIVVWLNGGNDVFDGGDGRDLLMVRVDAFSGYALVFDAANGTAQFGPGGPGSVPYHLQFSNFEDYYVQVKTDHKSDVVDTAGGNDTVEIALSGSDDEIHLGLGFDTLKVTGLTNVDGSTFVLGADGYSGSIFDSANRINFYGADTFSFTGTTGSDHLIGTAANDILDGFAGADTLEGGLGDDIYYVDNPGDVVVEGANAGNDTVILTYTGFSPALTSFSLAALPNIENLTANLGNNVRLTGNDANNVIIGGGGDDLLVGLGGADTLVGGMGNDAYLMSDGLDTVVEAVGGGNDTVYTTASYRLTPGAEIENFTVYDRSTTDPLSLIGNEFSQTIIGNAGANLLAGLGGADTLYGLGGDDAYLVEDGRAKVVEDVGGGNDTIYTTVSYTLTADSEIEVLTAYDRTTTDAMNLTGNRFDNTIYGTNGVNALVGGGGTDTLYGLGGDDSYLVDSSGDKVFEFAGGGNDTVYTTASYTLDPTAEVEVLTAYDRSSFDPLALTGNGFANTIYGTAGGNAIDGKGGADTIYGMGGADSIVFSTPIGPGTGNVDTLVGFQTGIGRLLLDDSVFTGLPLGQLAPGAFVQGTQANDADDRIIYDPSTGALYFDADGNGPGAAVQFATLVQGAVAASDIFIVTGHA